MTERETREITVREQTYTVDVDYTQSWAAFKLIRQLGSNDVSDFEKLDLSFKFIERATGVDESRIVELAGGENAPAQSVVMLAAEIVQAIDLKN